MISMVTVKLDVNRFSCAMDNIIHGLVKHYLQVSLLLASLLLLPIVAQSAPKSTADNYIPQDFDVIDYKIRVEIDSIGGDSLRGNCSIAVKWNTDSDGDFYVDLHQLDISQIMRMDGLLPKEVPFSILFDTIDNCEYIILPQPDDSQSGDTTIYNIVYTTALEQNQHTSGLMIEDQIYVLGVGFYDEWVSMGRDWFPGYDHPSDKATFEVTIVTDADLFSVSAGNMINDIVVGDKRTRTFVMESQMTTYNATFAIGDFLTIDQEYPVYCQEDVYDKTKEIVDIVPEAVSFFSSVFGEYPFQTLGYVMVDEGTIEQQALIMQEKSIAVSDYNSGDTTTLTTVHELAHQWFGNDVSVYDYRDAWLSESFATYAEILWIEHLQGRGLALELLRKKLLAVLGHSTSGIPLQGFDRAKHTNYPLGIYYKGAVVLDMLRHLMGYDNFINALKDYQEQHGGGNATTDDFLAAVVRHKPDSFDLDDFVDSYILNGGYPELEISSFDKSGGVDGGEFGISIKQRGDKLYTPLPLELVVLFNDNTHINITTIMTEKELLLNEQLPSGFSVTDISRVTTNQYREKQSELVSWAWVVDYSSVETTEGNGSLSGYSTEWHGSSEKWSVSKEAFIKMLADLTNSEIAFTVYDFNGRLVDVGDGMDLDGGLYYLSTGERRAKIYFVSGDRTK